MKGEMNGKKASAHPLQLWLEKTEHKVMFNSYSFIRMKHLFKDKKLYQMKRTAF